MPISKFYEQNLKNLPKFKKSELDKMLEIEKRSIAGFKGDLHELESALGMMRIGHYFGWRVLCIIHNKRTIRKYEEILGIDIKDIFPPEGPLAERNHGFAFYQKVGNFWKIVSGDIKVEKRKETE